jgi:peptidoglycan/LPS O-acetylase OafA/YrhL
MQKRRQFPDTETFISPALPSLENVRIKPHMSRIQSLDGLRAIAISLVIISHCFGTPYFFPKSAQRFAGDIGSLGVRIFFVLSGYLITTMLIAERRTTGRINLKIFYLRRVFRLCPALYVYLGIVGLLGIFGLIGYRPVELLRAATYTTWYSVEALWTRPTWSLAIEEQFYLLWPAALCFFGIRGATRFALFSLILAPVIRVGLWLFLPAWVSPFENTFPTIADTLATGCLLAIWLPTLQHDRRFVALVGSRMFIAVPLAVCLFPHLGRIRKLLLSWDMPR